MNFDIIAVVDSFSQTNLTKKTVSLSNLFSGFAPSVCASQDKLFCWFACGFVWADIVFAMDSAAIFAGF
jgi:hypothetical protein